MAKSHNITLAKELNARLAHNEQYLAQSETARYAAACLSGIPNVSQGWLNGEKAAIEAENEWIRATLKLVTINPNVPNPR